MKFTAAGDAIIARRIFPEFKGFGELEPIISEGDLRFFNLETTINYEGECFASKQSGGTYLRTNPEVLEDLKKFGFNATNINNNHIMDFSYEGLFKTIDYVNKSGFVHAGAGRNLDEAAAPKYIDTKNGRVAIISVNSSLNEAMIAGKQTGRIKGRPGINPLRYSETYVVSKNVFNDLKELADKIKINVLHDIETKEGYHNAAPEGCFDFGPLRFSIGESEYKKTAVNAIDMARVEKAIYEAKLQADYIIISLHSHEMSGEEKENPADFAVEFAHKCIDAGAHAIIGHGPHLIRPVEVYKNCPVFYSLGDFVLQLYNVEFSPHDFFEKYNMDADETIHSLLKKRSKDFTIGLMESPKMAQAIIPVWEMENGILKSLKLYPIELEMNGNKAEAGLPRTTENPEIFERLSKISENYGVKMINKGAFIECLW